MRDQTLSFVPIPSQSRLGLEGHPANNPYLYGSECPGRFFTLATAILAEYDIALPEHQILEMIVRAAVSAQFLFFSAALHEPTGNELDLFIEEFVLRCVSTT